MRVNLLFGFLGSGKTTLVRRLLNERADKERMAVIVNEFGEVGIDGAILEGRDIDMVELNSGCLCCTLKGSLLNAVEELRDSQKVDKLVIEATGVAQPEEMIETFGDPSVNTVYEMGPMVTVVDSAKFDRLRGMLGTFYEAQVENADIVVLNKIDMTDRETLDDLREEVEELNPDATIIFTEQCDLDPAVLFEGPLSAVMREALGSPVEHGHDHDHGTDHDHDHDHDHGPHRHAPATSFVLDSSGTPSRAEVEEFFASLPDEVWRVKGFCAIDGEPHLIQYTMGQLDITRTEPRDNCHMVFIGKDMAEAALSAAFAFAGGGRSQ